MNGARILHVVQDAAGGAPAYATLLARDAERRGARAVVAVGRGDRIAEEGLAQVELPAAAAARTRALRRHVADADVVHVHGTRAGAWMLPLLPFSRSIVTLHGLHPLRRAAAPPARAAGWALVAATVAAADRVVCVSHSDYAELRRRRIPVRHLRVIRNAVGHVAFDGDGHAVRAELGAGDALLVLFLGRLDEAKDPLTAVEAARRLQGGAVLAVAGDGELRAEVERRAPPNVRVLGHRDDALALLAAADVVLNTSLWEGLSLGILEAMWAARAIVATDAAGNAEALGDTGLLVPRRDADAAAAAVERLRDARLREQLGAAARARVESCFDLDEMLDANAALYEELLSG